MGNKKKKKKQKKGNNYFEMFVELTDYSCKAADCLHRALSDFDAARLPQVMEEMHAIEHAADMDKHKMMEKLSKEFLPPIEREDIVSLGQEIDNVTDSLEDVLLKLYMYNITAVRPEAVRFCDTIVHCVKALKNTMKEFENYKKSICIHETIVEINRLEEEGDRQYVEVVHQLFSGDCTFTELFAWNQTFSRMERCCDACEKTANLVEGIIMKNT